MSSSSNAFQVADSTEYSAKKVQIPALALSWSREDQQIFHQSAERQSTMTASDKQAFPGRPSLDGQPYIVGNSCLPDVEIHTPPPSPMDLVEQYRKQTYNPNEQRRREHDDPRDAREKELSKLSKEDCAKIGEIADTLASRNPAKIQALLDSYKGDVATLARLSGAVSLEMNRREGKVTASSYVQGDKDDPTSVELRVYDSCTGGTKVYRVDAA